MNEDHYTLLSFIQSIIISIGLALYLKLSILNFAGCIFAIWFAMMIINSMSLAIVKEIKKPRPKKPYLWLVPNLKDKDKDKE